MEQTLYDGAPEDFGERSKAPSRADVRNLECIAAWLLCAALLALLAMGSAFF